MCHGACEVFSQSSVVSIKYMAAGWCLVKRTELSRKPPFDRIVAHSAGDLYEEVTTVELCCKRTLDARRARGADDQTGKSSEIQAIARRLVSL